MLRFHPPVRHLLLVILAAAGPSTPANTETTPATPSAIVGEQNEGDLASFDMIWDTVRSRAWRAAVEGLDWQAVRDELRPRYAAAKSEAERRALLKQMLSRLGLSHYALIPRALAGNTTKTRGNATPGITLRVLEGRALVLRVTPGSPAERAGIRSGWMLSEVEGKQVSTLIETLDRSYAASTMRGLMLVQELSSLLSGAPREKRRAVFLDGADRLRSLTLELAAPEGRPTSFGNLPQMALSIRSELIDGPEDAPAPIGLLAFNAFLDPVHVMAATGKLVKACSGCAGIVIDLRGNPGGIGAMAMGLAGWFTADSGRRLGTMHTRDGELHFAVFPRAQPFTGRLAILIDEASASTSEIFASGLQDLGRARVFGRRSAGAALPSVIVDLPSGDAFQYAIADYVSAGGRSLEGIGVLPDETIVPTREQLLAGRDPVLEKALSWLRGTEEAP